MLHHPIMTCSRGRKADANSYDRFPTLCAVHNAVSATALVTTEVWRQETLLYESSD